MTPGGCASLSDPQPATSIEAAAAKRVIGPSIEKPSAMFEAMLVSDRLSCLVRSGSCFAISGM